MEDIREITQLDLMSSVMIDHCEASRIALSAVGLRYLLCDWHAWKNIGEKIKKKFPDKSIHDQVRLLSKQLQRAVDEGGANQVLCRLRKVSEGTNYVSYPEQHYTSGEWAKSFCDRYRDDTREGLFNTNNASETFFRTLLRR